MVAVYTFISWETFYWNIEVERSGGKTLNLRNLLRSEENALIFGIVFRPRAGEHRPT